MGAKPCTAQSLKMSSYYSLFNFIVEGILLIIVGGLGVIGNLLCIIWFSRKKVQKSFHRLMLTLAVYDGVYVLLSIILFGLPSVNNKMFEYGWFNHVFCTLLPFAQIGLTGSIYLTLSIAIERYTTVCHPFFKLSHSWSATLYIIPISMFSVLYNIPKFYEHVVEDKIVPIQDVDGSVFNITQSEIKATELRENESYVKIYLIILNLLVHGIIPLLLLTILNIVVYKQLYGMRNTGPDTSDGFIHHKEIKLAQVSLVIVAVFIICHAVRWVPNIWELKQSQEDSKDKSVAWPVWIDYTTSLSHLLTVFSSSVNFYIYTYKHDVPEQPNIVLILADDFGYNDVGYHNPYVLTPNIDELARTGLILEQSYVQPFCTPTRSALLTGVYPYLMGRQGLPLGQNVPTGLTLERKLLPQYLKEKGYVTHAIGKWHLGFCNEKYLPTNRGFDSHYGYYGGGQYYYSHVHYRTGGYDFVYNAETDLSANNTYGEELFANRFTEVIQEHVTNEASAPLFVYMAHQATHEPLEPPQEFLDLYPNIADDLRKNFFGTASLMDLQVGKMVQDLKDAGLYENTIIIFLGDNGGRHIAGGNNWPLRGEKSQVYEGGVRTPGFIHSPLLQNSGLISTKLTHVTDWLPTIYHLAGATDDEIEKENFNGVNQWSCIQDPSRPDARDEIVINLDDDDGVTFGALRQGQYKLVKYSTQFGESDWFLPPEWNSTNVAPVNKLDIDGAKDYEIGLYDVSTDMEERINLLEELPEIYDQMSLRLEELKVDLVPKDQPKPVDGGMVDGVWTTGWC